jgi:hypothetical protein
MLRRNCTSYLNGCGLLLGGATTGSTDKLPTSPVPSPSERENCVRCANGIDRSQRCSLLTLDRVPIHQPVDLLGLEPAIVVEIPTCKMSLHHLGKRMRTCARDILCQAGGQRQQNQTHRRNLGRHRLSSMVE